jgi:hypothetical protein
MRYEPRQLVHQGIDHADLVARNADRQADAAGSLTVIAQTMPDGGCGGHDGSPASASV